MQTESRRRAPPVVMSFAASDPTGGAGMQADLLTFASMGCHPLTVITAITVQDTAGVEDMLGDRRRLGGGPGAGGA
ncbi:MAG: bifunctional hydroxymethylpyrimidine kinase/phosphomethylpyrimidine kinase [Rhodospirillales bacterium]